MPLVPPTSVALAVATAMPANMPAPKKPPLRERKRRSYTGQEENDAVAGPPSRRTSTGAKAKAPPKQKALAKPPPPPPPPPLTTQVPPTPQRAGPKIYLSARKPPEGTPRIKLTRPDPMRARTDDPSRKAYEQEVRGYENNSNRTTPFYGRRVL